MDGYESNIAAWMIGGGLKSTEAARDRSLEHIRALRASRTTSPGLMSRLAAVVSAIRPSATPVDPACCPA